MTCLANPQNGNRVLFTMTQNSLYRGSLYQGLSVHKSHSVRIPTQSQNACQLDQREEGEKSVGI